MDMSDHHPKLRLSLLRRMRRVLTKRNVLVGISVSIACAAALTIYGSGAHAGALSGRPTTPSAAASIHALSATPTVAIPASLNGTVAAIDAPAGPAVSAAAAAGNVNRSQAHLLLSNVGSSQASLYATTTDNGKVCILATEASSGCIGQFDADTPIAWVGKVQSSGEWANVEGLVPDDVSGVALDYGTRTQQALLKNNAFYVEPDGTTPRAILVSYDDGTSQSVPLPTF